jgi:TolA-binding protein
MTRSRHDNPEDRQLSDLYRSGASEQPPANTDETILAAARREAQSRRGEIRKARTPHWTVPLSVAAVLALTVGLGLVVRHDSAPEQLGVGSSPAVREMPAPERAPAADLGSRERAAPAPESIPMQGVAAKKATRAPEPSATSRPPEESAAGAVDSLRQKEPLAPEEWLQQIVQLRKEGKVKRADESLREFRKQYPDYPIPETLH